MSALNRFRLSTNGATAIEYALIAFIVSISIVTGARLIGSNLSARYYTPIAANLS